MKKRKKGATLIFVIVIFMFVIVVSTTMLSMVVGNYKARVFESDRIENLYSSESGLDIAYNITGKTIEGGIKYAYYQVAELRFKRNSGFNQAKYNTLNDDINYLNGEIVRYQDLIDEEQKKDLPDRDQIQEWYEKIKKCKKGINTDQSVKEKLLKEEFKRAFKDYIKEDESSNAKTDVLQKSIEDKKYRDVSLAFEDVEVDNETITEVKADFKDYNVVLDESSQELDTDYPKLVVTKLNLNESDSDESDKITNNIDGEIHNNIITFYKVSGESYDLTVESQFLSKDTNDSEDSLRTVSCAYKIFVPEYDDVLWSKSSATGQEYTILEGKLRGITIGGNMDINNTNLKVVGDIFVQGKNTNSEQVYGKYQGGINITGSDVYFEPLGGLSKVNVSTRKTFNIRSGSNINANGKIYAGNIYAGEENGDFVNDSTLTANELITNNDLSLTAKNTNMTIGSFYGINDKNYIYDEDDDYKNKNIRNISSSIIINGYRESDGSGQSTVKIEDEAYIMGTAHINTEESYKTGESIAVKGNYTAYAVPVSPDEVFKYDEPLQVLDEDDTRKKAEHFSDYWNGHGKDGIVLEKKTADYGGIILPNPENIHSIGAIVYRVTDQDQSTFVRSNTETYSLEDEAEGGVVYNKRADYAENVYYLGTKNYDDNHNFYNEYLSGENNADTVSELLAGLNESNLNGYDWQSELNKQGEKVAVFNAGNEEIIIDHDVEGVIVTKGNVIIKRGVKFKGTIIAEGNLTVDGEGIGQTVIEYDEEVIKDVIYKNSEIFYSVFEQFEKTKEERQDYEETTEIKEVLDGKYDVKKFLQKKLWQLIQ